MRFAFALYLAIERDADLGRQHLAELFWPQFPESKARHSLRHLAYVLRSLGFPLEHAPSHLRLPASMVWLDYEGDLSATPTPARAARGFLPGYAPNFSPAFAEWLDRVRSGVHSRLRLSLLRDASTFRRLNRWPEAADAARRCLELDPFNEEATLALAESTALVGNKLEAISILDRYTSELGAAPNEIRLPATILRKRITERLPQAYEPGPASPLVGRESTLTWLTTQLRSAKSGRGNICYLWGPAGIGKSRVALEVARVAALDGVRIQRTVSQRSDSSRPLSVFCDLIHGLLDMPGALGCAPRSRQYLLCLSHPREPSNRFLEQLQVEAADAPAACAAVRQALLELIDAICEETTLLIVVDDAHWMDTYSTELIRELVGRSAHRRLMVLLAGRTPPAPDGVLGGVVPGLQLQEVLPLSHAESVEHFAALTGSSAAPPARDVVERYASLAEGNPYFLRELAAHWAMKGATKSPPQSILAAIDGRLSQLSPKSLRVLQVCALLGKNSTLDRLERVLDLRRLDVLDALEALDAQSVLKCDGEAVYAKHDLLSEAALASLSPTAGQFLHERIGQVLEADLTPTNYGSLLWDSAEHLRAARKVEAAARLMSKCADHALQLGFANEAIAIWERARELTPLNPERERQIRSGLIVCLREAQMWHRMLCVASETASENADGHPIEHEHDDTELAVLEAKWYATGQGDELLRKLMRCVRSVKASPLHRAQAGVLAQSLAFNLPDSQAATEAHLVVKQLVGGGDELLQHQLTAEILYHSIFGDLEAGVAAGRALVTLGRRSNNVTELIRALKYASAPLVYLGDLTSARLLQAEERAIATECGLVGAAVTATEGLFKSYFQEGNFEAAKDWIAACQEVSAPPDGETRIGRYHATQAQIGLLEDRPSDEALKDFRDYAGWADLSCFRFRSAAYAILATSQLAAGEEFHHRQEFETAFRHASRTGRQDFAAYAMWALRDRSGESEKAIKLLQHYVEFERRERSPLPKFLAKALQ